MGIALKFGDARLLVLLMTVRMTLREITMFIDQKEIQQDRKMLKRNDYLKKIVLSYG